MKKFLSITTLLVLMLSVFMINVLINGIKGNLYVAITGLVCYNSKEHIPQDGKEKKHGKEIV